MDLSFLNHKKIYIIGLGKTGLATARFLRDKNFDIYVWDDNQHKREEAIHHGFLIDDCQNLQRNDVVIWSPGIPHYGIKAHPIALRAKEIGIQLVSDLDILCRALPEQEMIAITGTNGKSTTTALINHVMQNFKDTRMGGNIGSPVLGLEPINARGIYVLECSSYQLELTPHLTPRVSVLLNITPDHLDRHGGMDQYIAAKENIFANVRNDSLPHIAVIGQDTEPCVQITNRLREQNIWTVIPISTKQILPHGVWVDHAGLLYDQNNYIADLTTHEFLKGEHNFENIAACYASIRYGFGYESAAIIKEIFSFKGLAHRQAFVRRIGKTIFINDSKATNADAAEKALKSYKNIYWIAGGRAKETGLSGLEQYFPTIKMTALIGESMEEFSKVLDSYNAPYMQSETLENAIHDLWNIAMKDREDSVILLSPACASFDQFTSFEYRGEKFENIVMNISEQINHIA